MKEDPNIDELLNSFLDGELPQRQHTEVQRMLAHDEHIAQRLRRLEKCRILVSSLPSAEAPAGMLDDILASLEKRPLPVVQPVSFKRSEGARHLLARRLATVAAMVGLLAILGAVIISILAPPETVPHEPIALGTRPRPAVSVQPKESPTVKVAIAEKSVDEVGQVAAEFTATLELKTNDFVTTDKFVRTAFENTGLLNQAASPVSREAKSVHSITCSQEDLNSLLADLQNVWAGLDSATLFVDTDRPDAQVVVHKVTADQICQIANQYDFQGRIKAAKYFAVLSNMSGLLPGKEPFTRPHMTAPDLTVIPRPVLTSGGETVKGAADQLSGHQQISLTIVVTNNRHR